MFKFCIAKYDTGSSVYPEVRANPFSWDTPPNDEKYIFATTVDEAFALFDEWNRSRNNV